MGCSATNNTNSSTKLKLVWDSDASAFDKDDLVKIVNYVDQTVTFLENNIADKDTDTFMFRIGVVNSVVPTPSIVAYSDLELVDKTKATNTSVSVDFIKISSKIDNDSSKVYYYQSKYAHNVTSNVFYFGLSNYTGNSFYNNMPVSPTGIMIPTYKDMSTYPMVNYGSGIPTVISSDREELPLYISNLMQYIVTNLELLNTVKNTVPEVLVNTGAIINEKQGDHLLYTVSQIISILAKVKANCQRMLTEFYPAWYEEIKAIMESAGLDQAFKDVKYGGTLDSVKLSVEIPTSKSNRRKLRGLIDILDIAAYKYGKPIANVTDQDKLQINDADIDNFFNYVFVRTPTTLVNSIAQLEESGDPKVADYTEIDRVIAARAKAQSGAVLTNEEFYDIRMWYTQVGMNGDDIGRVWSKIQHLPAPDLYASDSCKQITIYETTDDDGHTTSSARTEYFVYKIRNSWWLALPPAVKMELMFMGMTVKTESGNPCPYDQVISIIITCIMAWWMGPAAFEVSAAVGYAFVASTVLSLGMQMGIIKGAQARYAQYALVALAIFTAAQTISNAAANEAAIANGTDIDKFKAVLANKPSLTMVEIQESLSIVNHTVNLLSSEDRIKLQGRIDDENEESRRLKKQLKDSAPEYASNMRYNFSGVYDQTVRGAYARPDKYVVDTYAKFSSFGNKPGFRG